MAVLDPRKRGTTKFDLEKWFKDHPTEAKVNAAMGPRPYHQATDEPKVVKFPYGERCYLSAEKPEEEEHDIGWAVEQLCLDLLVCRVGWESEGMFIALQNTDLGPCIWLYAVQQDPVPWTCSQTDLFAMDWELS